MNLNLIPLKPERNIENLLAALKANMGDPNAFISDIIHIQSHLLVLYAGELEKLKDRIAVLEPETEEKI